MALKWILIAAGGLLVLGLIIFWVVISRGSVYIVGDSGYTAYMFEPIIHKTDSAGLRKVAARILKKDIIDMLWVSHTNDQYQGVMVFWLEGELQLMRSFKTQTEQSQLQAFREAMKPLGHEIAVVDGGHNGGDGEEFQVTNVEIALPTESEAIAKAVETALDHLEGKSGEFSMTGSLFANGPGEGTGIKFRVREDPLAEILGAK